MLEDVRAQLSAMSSANEDLARINALVAGGKGPSGNLFIVHGDADPLADPAGSRALANQLGSRATLKMISSANHVLEQSATEQRFAIDGLKTVLH